MKFNNLRNFKVNTKIEKVIVKETYFMLTTNYIVSLDVLDKWKFLYTDVENFEFKWSWNLMGFNRCLYLYSNGKKYKLLLYRTKIFGLSFEEYIEKGVLRILNDKCKNVRK